MNRSDVFLNVPFDARYERLFLALVTGVVAHGGTPRCVLELAASTNRLERLKRLIANCGISFHDLSRTQTSKTAHGNVPRFNMPFELGLAVMAPKGPRFFLLEERPYRVQATLSDMNGFDPLIHGGDPTVLLRKMRDALRSPKHTPSVKELTHAFEALRRLVRVERRSSKTEFFSRSSFLDIVTSAAVVCRNQGLL